VHPRDIQAASASTFFSHFKRLHRPAKLATSYIADIEQVLREKKSFTLRGMLDGIKTLQGRVVTWNRFASSVSIT
jgi:hypothetical protein